MFVDSVPTKNSILIMATPWRMKFSSKKSLKSREGFRESKENKKF